MKIHNRTAWTAILPRGSVQGTVDELDGLPNFVPDQVLGVSIHWMGTRGKFADRDPGPLFESTRKNDMTNKNYSDIMYNLGVAAKVEGAYILRGITNKGAANGAGSNGKTAGVNNSEYVSIYCLQGMDEKPTDLMFENIMTARNFVLSKYPNAFDVRPHSFFRPTACPGPDLFSVMFNKNGKPKKSFWDPKKPTPVEPSVPKFDCGLPPAPIAFNERSNNVYLLQNYLAFFNFYRVRVDGHFGPITRAAVMEWQDVVRRGGQYPYTVDGVYGPKTREAFCKFLEILSNLAK